MAYFKRQRVTAMSKMFEGGFTRFLVLCIARSKFKKQFAVRLLHYSGGVNTETSFTPRLCQIFGAIWMKDTLKPWLIFEQPSKITWMNISLVLFTD